MDTLYSKTFKVQSTSTRDVIYCRFGQGYQNLDEILALREEIEIFSKNINNPDHRNFFFERIKDFIKLFLDKEKIIKYQEQKKVVKDLQLA